MSEVADWLLGRDPAAPSDLRQRVVDAVSDASRAPDPAAASPDPAVARADALCAAARLRLNAVVRHPGRVRESALKLLVADALVTYACEAALEADRPLEALGRIVELGRTR